MRLDPVHPKRVGCVDLTEGKTRVRTEQPGLEPCDLFVSRWDARRGRRAGPEEPAELAGPGLIEQGELWRSQCWYGKVSVHGAEPAVSPACPRS